LSRNTACSNRGGVGRILSRARVLRDCGATPDRLVGVPLDVTEAGEPEKEGVRPRLRADRARRVLRARRRGSRSLLLRRRVVDSKLVKMQVYLAMREAVRNALRHSSCLRNGIYSLRVCDGNVYGLVEDDGEGFDPGTVGKVTRSWGCSR
jgi:hypothetical protein